MTGEIAHDGEARRVHRHEDHGLPAMRFGRSGLVSAHHDEDLAVRGSAAPVMNHLRPLIT